jgi:hypothetical protein
VRISSIADTTLTSLGGQAYEKVLGTFTITAGSWLVVVTCAISNATSSSTLTLRLRLNSDNSNLAEQSSVGAPGAGFSMLYTTTVAVSTTYNLYASATGVSWGVPSTSHCGIAAIKTATITVS